MKLRLDDDRGKTSHLQALLAALSGDMDLLSLQDDDYSTQLPKGKSARDVVTDYLTGVWDFVKEQLERKYGPALLRTLEVEVILTVPAVWSDKAKDSTFQAVSKARFGGDKATTLMILEPEAAAIETLKTWKAGFAGEDIKVGDNFVLCDCGGGTVDLIEYRVIAVSPQFKVEEAAVGTGDKCGATFVDRNFTDWLKDKIGEDVYDKIKDEKLHPGSILMRQFEEVKTSFRGTEVAILTVPPRSIEDNPAKGIEDGELTVTAAEMQGFLDPCINRTLELIDGQIAAVLALGSRVKYVFVVGGFGKSEYLFDKVQEYCVARGLEARRPDYPWSAIARGAVARSLEGESASLVQLRKCRRHYGTPISESFSTMRGHIEDDAYVDELTGQKFAKGQMHWLFSRGQGLSTLQRNIGSINCCRTFLPTDSRIFAARLVACDEEDPPKRYADDSAYNVATLHADLTSIPDSKFSRCRTGPGSELFYLAEFKIQLTARGTDMTFSLLFNGQEYESVTANYDA